MPTPDPDRAPSFPADLTVCLHFFSRLPVPDLGGSSHAHAGMADLGRAARALPLAGLVIAAPALVLIVALHAAGAPAWPASLLYLVLLVFATGALHEDGLADMADGFGGGRTKDRKLAIMRDSRIGTYGVLALILALGLKAAAIAHLFAVLPTASVALGLALAAMVSRFAMAVLWYGLPPARQDGLSAGAGRPDTRTLSIAAATILAAVALFLPFLSLKEVAAIVSAAVLATALVGALARHHLGGQTGDVLGGGQAIAETAILTSLALTAT